MALTRRRRAIAAGIAAAGLAALLGYLRDPPWLLHVSSGLRGWETDHQGTRFRWMSGRASFFVPSDASVIEIPVRAPFDTPQDWAITATVSLDGRHAERLELADDRWRRVRLHVPRGANRRVRRIDIHVNRTRPGERGLQVGEVRIVR